jgi:hypothetical protein
MDKEAYESWMAAPKVIINKHYALFREEALPGAQVVSDGVWGNIVELEGQTPAWYRVKLPNGKTACVSKFDAQPLIPGWLRAIPCPKRSFPLPCSFLDSRINGPALQ